jgi:hypothetical protein
VTHELQFLTKVAKEVVTLRQHWMMVPQPLMPVERRVTVRWSL